MEDKKKNIQTQFRNKLGEVAYNSDQIFQMLKHLELELYSFDKIRCQVVASGLTVDLKELGIRSKHSSRNYYWIPKSNLKDLIEKMDLPVTPSNFEDAAYELGYEI